MHFLVGYLSALSRDIPAINQIWWDELKKSIAACQSTHRIQASLDTDIFLRSFTELLYNARLAECAPEMLHYAASLMLKGVIVPQAGNKLNQSKSIVS